VHPDERANRHWDAVSRVTQLNHAARERRRLRRQQPTDAVVGQVVATTLTRGPGRDAGRQPPR
jgi:hypothetical protein